MRENVYPTKRTTLWKALSPVVMIMGTSISVDKDNNMSSIYYHQDVPKSPTLNKNSLTTTKTDNTVAADWSYGDTASGIFATCFAANAQLERDRKMEKPLACLLKNFLSAYLFFLFVEVRRIWLNIARKGHRDFSLVNEIDQVFGVLYMMLYLILSITLVTNMPKRQMQEEKPPKNNSWIFPNETVNQTVVSQTEMKEWKILKDYDHPSLRIGAFAVAALFVETIASH